LRPFFSVLITAYNRADVVERCVTSCTRQTFADREIVVVDDGSTDATAAVLAGLGGEGVRVVRHQRNRGIAAARASAVDHAAGSWCVMVDSDDELAPGALARLRELIDELPDGVRIIRSRLALDDGSLAPAVLPTGVLDYRGRLEWLEAITLHGGNSDAGHCMQREVLEGGNYFAGRRGAVEALWELDLARREPSLWVPDVLGLVHADAPNSLIRDVGARRLIERLLLDAPDQRWMAETMLERHGDALARYAPHYLRWVAESAALQSFLAGGRVAGLRGSLAAARAGAPPAKLAATALLGLAGPRALAWAKIGGRRARAQLMSRTRGGTDP
jgi:Glycosyl transferase family 2